MKFTIYYNNKYININNLLFKQFTNIYEITN